MVRKKSRLTARKHSSRGQALVRAQVPRCVQGGYSGPWHKYGKVADPKQRMSVTHRTQQERRAADHITTMYGKQQEADPASTMPRPVEVEVQIPEATGGGSRFPKQLGMYAVAINLGSADSPPLEAQAKEVVKKSGINANVIAEAFAAKGIVLWVWVQRNKHTPIKFGKVAAVLVWRKIGDRDAEILLAGTAPEHGGMRLVQQLVVELLKTQCVRCALHASSKAVSYWKEKHHFTAVKQGGCKWAKGRMFDPNVTGGLVMERARG